MVINANLEEIFTFKYRAPFDNGLIEHELDHILIGYSDKQPIINTDEVSEWKWMDINYIIQDLKINPEDYTIWFRLIFNKFSNYINKKNESYSK